MTCIEVKISNRNFVFEKFPLLDKKKWGAADVSHWILKLFQLLSKPLVVKCLKVFCSSGAESRQDFQACWAFLNIYCISGSVFLYIEC